MSGNNLFTNLKEIQLTNDLKGHFIHTNGSFSPDNNWLVYDTRNDDTHIARTGSIEMINVNTLEVRRLYNTKNQTKNGPGVGAVSFNPKRNQVLFIHGLQECNKISPYSFSRRTGVSIKTHSPQEPIFLDARDVMPPFTQGALRGGTHAHSWSSDGKWVSFTYNDDIMMKLSLQTGSKIKDLRMVGIMAPLGPVNVDNNSSSENLNGKMFSVVISEILENPEPGSNQIDRAYGDGWVGNKGYRKSNGQKQNRAVAFLGDTIDEKGNKLTELFIVDIPNDISKSNLKKPLEGTEKTRPNPPLHTVQRRVTYTNERKYPGIISFGNPVRSNRDGTLLFIIMKDEKGISQIYSVSSNDGLIEKLTDNNLSIDTSFDISPDGRYLVYGINENVYITDILLANTFIKFSNNEQENKSLRGLQWSKDGKSIAYNRKVFQNGFDYFQLFVLK
ncbi:DUF3748 domain-containing protein [Maribacter hydrothermalis]|uniref:WD40-like Beta Propeller Repeat n=1 Tax=Maribacter hydrothermalis TaxID=1836467 RepID=A0A1B7ZD20_9FLAO|nr:DUF3748 domain-containing protein [Maribacter hydrothermalis]APQ18779.1 hypothetical protein BTR34_16295 [Maribacter hydrothermalis]OBR41023.1 hypothetical protein A9200_14470 [Maribacter hydrothermalis]